MYNIKEKYNIVNNTSTKEKEKTFLEVELTDKSNYPGIIIGIEKFGFPESLKTENCNCQVEYNIIFVPEGKYEILEDYQKEELENLLKEIFLDIINSAIKEKI